MAAKKTTAATRGKARANAKKPAAKPAPKQPAKRATASKRAAPVNKPSAKLPSAKARAKKPSAKPPGAKPPRRSPVEAAVDLTEPATTAELEAAAASDDAEAKKPGALARLKSGVGNLFARMTGRKATLAEGDGDEPQVDRTIDIVTRDIIVEPPMPPPKRKKQRGAESP